MNRKKSLLSKTPYSPLFNFEIDNVYVIFVNDECMGFTEKETVAKEEIIKLSSSLSKYQNYSISSKTDNNIVISDVGYIFSAPIYKIRYQKIKKIQ